MTTDLKPRLKRFKPSSRCQACAYSVQNKRFHKDLLDSTYFNQDGLLSVPAVLKKHKSKLDYRNVMNHMQKHLAPVKHYNDEKKELIQATQDDLVQAIAIPDSKTAHEMALDDTIADFHKKLKEGRIKLTAATGLKAIQIKADIENKNKDRGLDFLKAFSAMGNGKERVSDT